MSIVFKDSISQSDYRSMGRGDDAYLILSKPLPYPMLKATVEIRPAPGTRKEAAGASPKRVYVTIVPSESFLGALSKLSDDDKAGVLNSFIDRADMDRSLSNFDFDVKGAINSPYIDVIDGKSRSVAVIGLDDIDGFRIIVKRPDGAAGADVAQVLAEKVNFGLKLMNHALEMFALELPELKRFIDSNPIFVLKPDIAIRRTAEEDSQIISEFRSELNNISPKELSSMLDRLLARDVKEHSHVDPGLLAHIEEAIPWDAKLLEALKAAKRERKSPLPKHVSSAVENIISGLVLLDRGNMEEAIRLLGDKGLSRIESMHHEPDILISSLTESLRTLLPLLRNAERSRSKDDQNVARAVEVIKEYLGRGGQDKQNKIK